VCKTVQCNIWLALESIASCAIIDKSRDTYRSIVHDELLLHAGVCLWLSVMLSSAVTDFISRQKMPKALFKQYWTSWQQKATSRYGSITNTAVQQPEFTVVTECTRVILRSCFFVEIWVPIWVYCVVGLEKVLLTDLAFKGFENEMPVCRVRVSDKVTVVIQFCITSSLALPWLNTRPVGPITVV